MPWKHSYGFNVVWSSPLGGVRVHTTGFPTSVPDTQYDNGESKIFRQSDNSVSGFSMWEQLIILCCLAHGKLAWLFHEPDTELDDCLNILLSYWVFAPTPYQSSLSSGPSPSEKWNSVGVQIGGCIKRSLIPETAIINGAWCHCRFKLRWEPKWSARAGPFQYCTIISPECPKVCPLHSIQC